MELTISTLQDIYGLEWVDYIDDLLEATEADQEYLASVLEAVGL